MRSNISGTTEHLVPLFLFATPAFLRWLVVTLVRAKWAASFLNR
jgi:hypothetical protein